MSVCAGHRAFCGASEELNLRLHPYQQNAGNCCAKRHFGWSRSTVEAEVICSHPVQLCALIVRLASVALPSALGHDGSALAAHYLDWPAALPVRRLLAAELARHRLRLPVALGNDANLAALAEHRHGAGRGARHLLYLMTGHRGIGG